MSEANERHDIRKKKRKYRRLTTNPTPAILRVIEKAMKRRRNI
jgi:hypothetical protein